MSKNSGWTRHNRPYHTPAYVHESGVSMSRWSRRSKSWAVRYDNMCVTIEADTVAEAKPAALKALIDMLEIELTILGEAKQAFQEAIEQEPIR